MPESERQNWPDDVLRVKDEMDLHAVAGSHGWAAFALADGKPIDHTPYPAWRDAVIAAKWDRDNFMFLEIRPDGMPYREAQGALRYARIVHQLGHRIPSPDWRDYEAASMPRTAHDRRRAARQLATGKPLYPQDVSYSNLPHFLRKGL